MSRNWKIPLEGDPELTTLLTNAQASRENICLQSEDFGTTWSAVGLQGIAETNQVAAPDGSLTADRLVDNSAGGSGVALLYQALSVEAATAYTISVYAKADQLNWLRLKVGDMAAADVQTYFNLDTGVLGGSGAGNVDQGIVDVGNGWYRCWISFVSDAVDTAIGFEVWVATADSVGTVDLDGTSSIYIWGAQLETGAAATPYIPTTTVARTITGFTPINSLVDDMHTAMETVLEVEGNINDLWARYKQLN